MTIIITGTNHKKAPIEWREKIAFKNGEQARFIDEIIGEHGISEAVVLSTCNRTELYVVTKEDVDGKTLLRRVIRFLDADIDDADIDRYTYTMTGADAVKHLFEVTASLDSLVVGESQVTGQVKEAYYLAKEKGSTGRIFNHLFQRAFKTSKKVKSITGISKAKVSVSSVAVDLIEKVLGDLTGKTVLIIGSGKIGKLSARHFVEKGVGQIFVANRTPEKAEALAREVNGEVVALRMLDKLMSEVDIVVGCTSASQHVMHRKLVLQVISRREGKPLFILDLGVPRNVDPGAGDIEGVHLYNIDQLDEIVSANMVVRQMCADEVDRFLDAEVQKTMEQLSATKRSDLLAELMAEFEHIRKSELERSLGKIKTLTDDDKAEIDYMTKRILGKVMHKPLTRLKPPTPEKDRQKYLETLKALFMLNPSMD